MTHGGEFRIGVLGPLEVTWDGRRVPIRGLQQRAVLGYLSLHANTVVATSDLIKALWRPTTPSTARKMLHNAVAGVRAALAGSPAELLTHAPGYLLRVPPGAIDLWRFMQLAELGRSHLIAGDLVAASSTLQEALGQWCGAILADLAEAGIDWPELAAAQSARLAVLEDYAETQVARGNYQEVIERLEPVITGIPTPPRERLSAQLMISLYRSGRQADALGVYRQTRSVLVEQTGLDPSRYLQDLEKAMLAHDPMLTAPPRLGASEGAALITVSERNEPETAFTSELKPVTVLLVRAGVADPAREHGPEDLRAAWRDLDATMAEVVARHRGLVRREAIGSLWTVWFGVPQTGDDDVERAVRAARELRQEFRAKGGPHGVRLAFQLAVASGEALVRWGGSYDAQIEVTGGVLDVALALLTDVGLGELRICDITRRLAGWALTGPRQDPALLLTPMIERDREMRLLRRLLEDVTLDRRPSLLTVLGEPGIGKTRLVNEFLGQVGEEARCVIVRDVLHDDPTAEVSFEVDSALRAMLDTSPVYDGTVAGAVLSNRRAIAQLAEEKPVVLVMEDLHGADQRVLDYLDDLMYHATDLPLLIVAVARLEWQGQHRHWRASGVDTTIKLEPLSDTGMRQLLKAMFDDSGHDRAALVDEIVSRVRGNPKLAVEYACHIDEVVAGEPVPPAAVQRLIAAQLDRLPARQKATIQDAAVLGDVVSASALAAVSGRSTEEVRQQLRVLEAHVLMRRAVSFAPADRGAERYEFWNPLVRDVAYAQLPRCIRATKHSRAATWLSTVGQGEFAEYHTRQAAPLTMTVDDCEERQR